MLRRTFLSTLAALPAAALSPLKALGIVAREDSEPDQTLEIRSHGTRGGLRIQWWQRGSRMAIHQIGTGLPLKCIERTQDGWWTFQNAYAGIRIKVDAKADKADESRSVFVEIDYLYWSASPLPLVHGVKHSSKSSDVEADWLDVARFPLGEINNTARAS